MVNWGFILFAIMVPIGFSHFAYAETITSDQMTLSGDLQNNPTAQEILEKIEKSKRWIEKL